MKSPIGVCPHPHPSFMVTCTDMYCTSPQVSGYALRGLRCYYKASAGGVVCFDGKTQCPDIVTPEYLSKAPGQGICQVTCPCNFARKS